MPGPARLSWHGRQDVLQLLVLIAGDELDPGIARRLHAFTHRAGRAEVVALGPARALAFGMTVEGVEAYPESERVGPRHDRPQPLLVSRRPWPRVVLTARFDHRPPEVGPSPIVGRAARDQGLRAGADCHLRTLLGGLRRGK